MPPKPLPPPPRPVTSYDLRRQIQAIQSKTAGTAAQWAAWDAELARLRKEYTAVRKVEIVKEKEVKARKKAEREQRKKEKEEAILRGEKPGSWKRQKLSVPYYPPEHYTVDDDDEDDDEDEGAEHDKGDGEDEEEEEEGEEEEEEEEEEAKGEDEAHAGNYVDGGVIDDDDDEEDDLEAPVGSLQLDLNTLAAYITATAQGRSGDDTADAESPGFITVATESVPGKPWQRLQEVVGQQARTQRRHHVPCAVSVDDTARCMVATVAVPVASAASTAPAATTRVLLRAPYDTTTDEFFKALVQLQQAGLVVFRAATCSVNLPSHYVSVLVDVVLTAAACNAELTPPLAACRTRLLKTWEDAALPHGRFSGQQVRYHIGNNHLSAASASAVIPIADPVEQPLALLPVMVRPVFAVHPFAGRVSHPTAVCSCAHILYDPPPPSLSPLPLLPSPPSPSYPLPPPSSCRSSGVR